MFSKEIYSFTTSAISWLELPQSFIETIRRRFILYFYTYVVRVFSCGWEFNQILIWMKIKLNIYYKMSIKTVKLIKRLRKLCIKGCGSLEDWGRRLRKFTRSSSKTEKIAEEDCPTFVDKYLLQTSAIFCISFYHQTLRKLLRKDCGSSKVEDLARKHMKRLRK